MSGHVEPCGWCRTPTRIFVDDLVWCQNPGCPHGGVVSAIDVWNPAQLRIVEARKKDFEAGIRANLELGYEGGMDDILDLSDGFSWEEEFGKAFDDYIAGRAG